MISLTFGSLIYLACAILERNSRVDTGKFFSGPGGKWWSGALADFQALENDVCSADSLTGRAASIVECSFDLLRSMFAGEQVRIAPYSMSFTTGTLLHQESLSLARLYKRLGSWDAVRETVDSENVLQTRTLKSSRSLSKVIISRLKGLAPEELQLLLDGSPQEQRYLLWIAVCRRHRFIAEFATEILRERYICLKTQLPYDEFDTFFNGKAAWHASLDGLRPSTRAKLRQVLFKMMREADLLTEDFTIKRALVTAELVRAIPAANRNDLMCLPVYDNDLRRILHELGN